MEIHPAQLQYAMRDLITACTGRGGSYGGVTYFGSGGVFRVVPNPPYNLGIGGALVNGSSLGNALDLDDVEEVAVF